MDTIDINKAERKRLKKEFEDDSEALKQLDEMSERFRIESKKWCKATTNTE